MAGRLSYYLYTWFMFGVSGITSTLRAIQGWCVLETDREDQNTERTYGNVWIKTGHERVA